MRGGSNLERRLLELIELIHESEDCEQMLSALFAELRRVFAFSSGLAMMISTRTFELHRCLGFEIPAGIGDRYLQHYAPFDPYVRRHPADIRLNRTLRLSDVARYDRIARTAFVDFLEQVPYRHAAATVVGRDGQPLAVITLHRQKHERDFGPTEMAIVDRLAPHIGRAIALRNLAADSGARDGGGLLAVAANGELLFANARAQQLLAAVGVAQVMAALPPGPGRLRCGSENCRVSRVPWRPASLLTHLALRKGNGGANGEQVMAESWALLRALAENMTIIALVPFRQRDNVRGRLARYRLSPREVAVVELSVCARASQAQIAERLNIGVETVKTHLHGAYGKIGVASRLELLARLLGVDAELPPA